MHQSAIPKTMTAKPPSTRNAPFMFPFIEFWSRVVKFAMLRSASFRRKPESRLRGALDPGSGPGRRGKRPMKFTFTPLEIPDLIEIQHERAGDARGFFSETFRKDVFERHGLPPFVQENHSRSTKGVLRGLHYQNPPKAQGKLVRCARGTILDVAVDIRRNSPHF